MMYAWIFTGLINYTLAVPAASDIASQQRNPTITIERRETPPSSYFLPNLPTLPPASYCHQILVDGYFTSVLYVTQTGASCPHYSVSRTYTEVVAPSRGPPGGIDHDPRCTLYRKQLIVDGKLIWQSINNDLSLNQCEQYCKATGQITNNNKTIQSATCYASGDLHWSDPPGQSQQVGVGRCLCNNDIVDTIASDFVNQALPAIGEIACKVWYTAIKFVLELGLNALPGIGQTIGPSLTLAYQAAQVAAYTFDDASARANAYNSWVASPTGVNVNSSTYLMDKICGNKFTPPEAEKIFGDFSTVSDAIGISKLWSGALKAWPPPYPRGSGSLDDMLDYIAALGGKPRPKPKGKPDNPRSRPSDSHPSRSVSQNTHQSKNEPTKTDASKSERHKSSTTSCTRKNGRRAPGNDDKCNAKITVTSIGRSVTLENAKQPDASTCDWLKYPDACAHYYSVALGDPQKPGKTRFTCEDDNERVDAQYTASWKKQHNKLWRQFHDFTHLFPAVDPKDDKAARAVICGADEWPPAYFVPKGDEEKPEWGQRIRLIPQDENAGVGQLWNGFCEKHDGGKYNGQRISRPKKVDGKIVDLEQYSTVPIQEKLLKDGRLPKPVIKDGGKGTITEIYDVLTFTRAVFEMKFNWGEKPPSENNDWLLRENACWPSAIAPDDPGFVLLTDDPWYKTNKKYDKAKETSALYAKPPSRKRFDEASKIWMAKWGQFKGAQLTDEDVPAADEPPPKAPRPNPPSRIKRQRLELVGDRILLRDDDFNVTRPLTDEEMRYNVEVIDCADRHCSRERELSDGDESLFISGAAPPSTPASNIAVSTVSATSVASQHAKRSALSADLPVVTSL